MLAQAGHEACFQTCHTEQAVSILSSAVSQVTDVKKRLKFAKKFWSTLPDTVCEGERVSPRDDDCWNGTAKSRYQDRFITSKHQVMSMTPASCYGTPASCCGFFFRYESVVMNSGLANQVANPDVEVDVTKPDVVIRRQIVVLREMTTWLKAAYSGNDISFENGKCVLQQPRTREDKNGARGPSVR